jgi:hypothetical protein
MPRRRNRRRGLGDWISRKGTGIFRADCTIAGGTILDWRTSRWTFNGKAMLIETAPSQEHTKPLAFNSLERVLGLDQLAHLVFVKERLMRR